jgi:protein SCO1
MRVRNIILVLIVVFVGISTLWAGTDGFHAFTTEGARRYDIAKHPRLLPDVRLVDQNGRYFKLTEEQGKLVLMTFMYTRCGDVCPELEANFRQVYEGISERFRGKQIVFLSVSFDTARDDVESLHHHAGHYGADGIVWRMTTVPNPEELHKLLEISEVTMIPDAFGGYEHNAAFYLVNPQSELIKIYDYNAPAAVIRELNTLLEARSL